MFLLGCVINDRQLTLSIDYVYRNENYKQMTFIFLYLILTVLRKFDFFEKF